MPTTFYWSAIVSIAVHMLYHFHFFYLTLSHRDLKVRYWSTQYRRVTDGQTSCHGIVRSMHTRRAVKFVNYS